ncbi:hypothetical protein PRECH8_12420 [Insulibacter thermoxylanivorax]|uniref:YneF family protein n=1 Tax=Insulibacter thermoxylanivorax TaxID=2749268 RepID=A0A916QBZ8_9BACL|nr:YneF family protein [Insulibacter thermoxylanivorax]GFR37946.1 hypothetical protein PRECH8_12420 [Insulibacter thermoxylanivorax]
MWDVILPILTGLAGILIGFFIGVFYLRKQLERMQSDPKMIQEMARKMGYKVNKQQLNQVQNMLKKQKFK